MMMAKLAIDDGTWYNEMLVVNRVNKAKAVPLNTMRTIVNIGSVSSELTSTAESI